MPSKKLKPTPRFLTLARILFGRTTEKPIVVRLKPGHVLVIKVPRRADSAALHVQARDLEVGLETDLGFKVPIIVMPNDCELEIVDATAVRRKTERDVFIRAMRDYGRG